MPATAEGDPMRRRTLALSAALLASAAPAFAHGFRPARIEVREGETVRFVMRHRGRVTHEFVSGTKAELEAHAELMKKHPGMEHDEPYMAHVAPGKTGEIVWTFNRAGEFDFACLIPGHYDAGMVGRVVVRPATKRSPS
jgi:uncharacterized cupredoxin-like copper-binding protein